jgi:hypothetical protein
MGSRLAAVLYANSTEQCGTQQYKQMKPLPSTLTEMNFKVFSRTQLKLTFNSAKPLFIGSIPTAA